jgi:hypothetical protein
LDDGDDVQKKKRKTKDENKNQKLVPTSFHLDYILYVQRLVYDAGFSLEMRNSRTVRTLQSLSAFGCIVSADAPICCLVGNDHRSLRLSRKTRKIQKNKTKKNMVGWSSR